MTALPVRVDRLTKRFDAMCAVDDASVAIEPGELFFLLGPSGCGKTTLLRCVAGFCRPEAGMIRIGARDITHLPPHQRDTGMVFQSYALWPHLTLAENVAFGLEMRRTSRADIRRRVADALARVHLADRAQARPNQLSGGQQQRVALARALVVEPQCLLLDEPLSNLDAKLRLEMRAEIRRICKQVGITAIYVTHDQKEALSIADRLAVMRAGRIEQVGAPAEVYGRPANRFVAAFIGEGNFIGGHVVAHVGRWLHVQTPLGLLHAEPPTSVLAPGAAVTLCIRPEVIRFDPPPNGMPNLFSGRRQRTVYQGEMAQHELVLTATSDTPIEWKSCELNPAAPPVRPNEQTTFWVSPGHVIALPG